MDILDDLALWETDLAVPITVFINRECLMLAGKLIAGGAVCFTCWAFFAFVNRYHARQQEGQ